MTAAEDSFISSTNWTERMGPACAIEYIKRHQKLNLKHNIKNEDVKNDKQTHR